jgi:hypothetical protein
MPTERRSPTVNPTTTTTAAAPTTPALPHGPLAHFLDNPSSTLHQLADWVGRVAISFAEHYLPVLLGLLILALVAKALLIRWHSRRGAASASHLEILPPPTVDPHGAEVFWANVHALLQPSWLTRLRGRPQLVFEVRSTGQRVHFDLWAPIPTTAHIGRAAAAAWPGATVLPSESGAPLVGARLCAGRQLRLARSLWLPIATDHVLDPLRSVLDD